MNEKNGAIFRPIFRGTNYLHHKCSECGHKIYLVQDACGGVAFYETRFGTSETIKFCPHCGNEVVRFDEKPEYEARIDYKPLDVFSEVRKEYERKCKWLWHCFISDDHREAIRAVLPMMKSDECVSGTYKEAAGAARLGAQYDLSYHGRKKLASEFGSAVEAEAAKEGAEHDGD